MNSENVARPFSIPSANIYNGHSFQNDGAKWLKPHGCQATERGRERPGRISILKQSRSDLMMVAVAVQATVNSINRAVHVAERRLKHEPDKISGVAPRRKARRTHSRGINPTATIKTRSASCCSKIEMRPSVLISSPGFFVSFTRNGVKARWRDHLCGAAWRDWPGPEIRVHLRPSAVTSQTDRLNRRERRAVVPPTAAWIAE